MIYPNNTVDQLQKFLESNPSKKLMLTWDLWAWKTTLTKHRARLHGIDPNEVTSPTYTYQQSYHNKILHIDMRRMEVEEDLLTTGILWQIEEYDYIVIERPKWTHHYADTSRLHIHCKYDGKERSLHVIEDSFEK